MKHIHTVKFFSSLVFLVFLSSCSSNVDNGLIELKPSKVPSVNRVKNTSNARVSVSYLDVIDSITAQATQDKNNWIHRKSDISTFYLTKPIKQKSNIPTVRLVKGEFETTDAFNQRVFLENKAIFNREAKLELKYQNQLKHYSNSLKSHNKTIEEEKELRLAASAGIYTDYIKKGIEDVLGAPHIKNLSYNADLENFSGTLYSANNDNFNINILVRVPLNKAKSFKNNLPYVQLDIDFNLEDSDGSLYINKIGATFKGITYPVSIVKKTSTVAKKATYDSSVNERTALTLTPDFSLVETDISPHRSK